MSLATSLMLYGAPRVEFELLPVLLILPRQMSDSKWEEGEVTRSCTFRHVVTLIPVEEFSCLSYAEYVL